MRFSSLRAERRVAQLQVVADTSPTELHALETIMKKIGKRAENLGTGVNPKC